MLKLLLEGESQRIRWLELPETLAALEANHGIQLRREGPSDATIVASELYNAKAIPEVPAPTVVLDISDPVTLRPEIQRAAQDPLVKAILRPYVFREPATYRKDIWGVDHHHVATLETALSRGDLRQMHPIGPGARLSDAELSKVRLGFSGGLLIPHGVRRLMLREGLPQQLQPLMSRPLDVIFMGQLQYANKGMRAVNLGCSPEMHREFMLRQLETLFDLKVKVVGTNGNPDIPAPIHWIDNRMYVPELAQARIAISPWGWSCWSHRDFDAIMAGCLIIKPRCDDVATLPDIFAPNSRWLYWCKPDMSDLRYVVRDLLAKLAADPATYDQRHVVDNPEQLHKTCSVEQVAATFAQYVRDALGI